jgi:hypothetical protein
LVVALFGVLGAGMVGDPASAASPAAIVGGGLTMAVNATDPLTPTIVLTNTTGASCQVATTAFGTVGITSLSQLGKSVTPIATDPSFPDGLDVLLANDLATLAPGASATVELPVAPVGSSGHSVETVTWSQDASLGELYPVAPTGALQIVATYAVPPVLATGPPLCPAAAAGTTDTTSALASPSPGRGVSVLVVVAAAVLLLLVVVFVVVLIVRRSRRGAAGGAVVLLLLAAVVGVQAWRAPAAFATIAVDPSLQSAYNQCAPVFSMAGGDPANLLPTLNDPKSNVKIVPANGDQTHEISVAGMIIIFWDPNDRHAYVGGGNADPCTSLYHEMYHGKEDLTGGQDHSPCVTAAGPSGLPVNEVNATKAQNVLRIKLGLPPRTTYGNTPLPAGPCLPKDQQPPPKRNCVGAGCGDFNADPHLLTFDGLRYNFQAVGEFVASRQSDDPGFQVQVRQQPAGNSTTVAVGTAVAASVAGDTVEVDLAADGMQLVVGGHAVALASIGLRHGGSVTLDTSTIPAQLVLAWPDGSRAFITNLGRYGLHLTVHPAAVRAGKLVGLLGNYDGVPGNDLKTSAGKAIPSSPAFSDLYPAYADSWRITDATSLFTYPTGATTATYTDRSLPTAPPDLSTLPGAAAATLLCQRVGITDPQTLADCTLDVAETGQAVLADGDLTTQAIAESVPTPTPGPTTSQTVGPSQQATLTVSQPNGAAKLSFQGSAGQRLFVAYQSPTIKGKCGVLDLQDPSGNLIGSGCIDNTGAGNIGGYLLDQTGTYTVIFTPRDGDIGQLHVALTFSTDVHTTIPTDGSPTTITITTPGQVGFLTFHGTIGDRVLVEATGSTIPSQCGVPDLRDPGGNTIDIGCVAPDGTGLLDGTQLATTGQFTVVVDPGQADTGQITLRLIISQDQHGTIALGGPSVVATIAKPGQIAQFTFVGTKGEQVSIDITASTVPPQCGIPLLRTPDGTGFDLGCINNDGTGSLDHVTLPTGGSYTIEINPGGLGTGTVNFALHAG